ncbi:MAG: helix-turn-helix transcriptional regulator [Gemmataceae bacterium]
MPRRKKRIRHDEVVGLFGEKLRELRLSAGLSQADLARAAQVTTNYISRLEGGGAAPGIDLVARLCSALGATVGDLVPISADRDALAVIRDQARTTFELLMSTADRAMLVVLNQVLVRLKEQSNG